MKNVKWVIAAAFAGLFSISTTAQAIAVAPEFQTTLNVTVDGGQRNINGGFDQNSEFPVGTPYSVFYELFLDTTGHSITNVSSLFQSGANPAIFKDLSVTLFKDNGDTLFGIGDTAVGSASSNVAGMSNFASLSAYISGGTRYFLEIVGFSGAGYSGNTSAVSTVPVPAAGILFASALFGAGVFGRRKKKASNTAIVDAFARAS